MALTAKKVYAVLKRQISDMEAKLNSPVRYKGTVASADLLPLNPAVGDMYNIESKSIYGEAGMNVAWNGIAWDTMGAPVDMSLYIKSDELAEWAKQSQKPSYTAEEVGALPQNTKIPSKTSDLQNDSGFLTKIPDTYPTKEEISEEYLTVLKADERYQPKGTYLTGTDKDLVVSGEAADAKAVGEKLNKITEILSANEINIESALSNYFALRRNGKVFTTKIYKYETSTSPVGVKMNANENMVAEPSVGRKEGRDDYAQYGLFHHFTCNFSVDENGFNHVDVLEGQTGFTKYGKVQVGEVTMSAWFGIEDTEDAILYHYSDSQTELTPYPMKESINPDGTISPFMIHVKYAAGDIDGAPYSSKGLAPANGCQATQARKPVSYTGMITYMHKLGNHYCGTTSWDLFYRQLMMIIKYATTHSQSIMAGCTSYNSQNQNLVEETGVMRVVLTKAQVAAYVIGSYVSIGDVGENTNRDRYFEYMHNKAYSVKVTKIEDVDDNNAAVYVDAPEAFDTTLTTWITTMPWHSGATDEVAGSDGSPNSNTNGKDPYKIQGVETCIGAYEVLGNVVMDIVTGADGNPARDVYVCEDASTLSSNIATVRANYKKAIAQVAYTAASWKYITEETTDPDLGIMIPTKVGGGSTTGFADGLYTDAGTSGQREWLALGVLSFGASAGLWFLAANYVWSGTYWCLVSGVSPNGTRGEWQATA